MTANTGVVVYSKTAALNNTSDSAQNWQEGQAPASVNDSARGGNASIAKWRDDNNGSLSTAGTSTAYTLTTNQNFAGLNSTFVADYTVAFQIDEDCGATVTLNVDGLGAKPLRSAPGVELVAGALKSGGVYSATYKTSNSGEWILKDVTPTIIAAGQVVTASIANDAVTYAKLQNVSAQYKILARKSASAGDVEECSLSEVLDFVTSAADGDILYRNGGAWTRLAKGTDGNYLSQASGIPAWAAAPVYTKEYTSSDFTFSYGSAGSLSHGLGVIPKQIITYLVCQSSENGYSTNDVVWYNASEMAYTLTSSAVVYAITNGAFDIPNKSTGVYTNISSANWRLRVKALA